MAIGCFTKSSKISLHTRTDKKLYLFFKLNNLNFLSDLAAAAAAVTNKYMKLSPLHTSLGHSDVFFCEVLVKSLVSFLLGFLVFFYV